MLNERLRRGQVSGAAYLGSGHRMTHNVESGKLNGTGAICPLHTGSRSLSQPGETSESEKQTVAHEQFSVGPLIAFFH